MSTDDQRKLVESFLTRNLYSDEEEAQLSNRLGVKQVAVLAGTALAVAMSRKYRTKPSQAEIAEYARYVAENYRNDEAPVKALVVEALIRANLGEVNLVEDLTPDDMIPHEILIAYDIFISLNLDEAGLNAFVDDVMHMADEYFEGRLT